MVVNLEMPSSRDRLPESLLWNDFEEIRPLVLGALLDAVSIALQSVESVHLTERPRMADFAEWVTAAEPGLPWGQDGFIVAYANSRQAGHEIAFEGSLVGQAVLMLMQRQNNWHGTASELLLELALHQPVGRNSADWPKTPKGLANALRRIAPTLRRFDVDVEMGRREATAQRRRLILLSSKGDLGAVGRNESKPPLQSSEHEAAGGTEPPAQDCPDGADRHQLEQACAAASS